MKIKSIALIVASLSLMACFGGGGNDAVPITNSPFAGQWQGTWSSAALAQDGTASVTIGTNGVATGTTHNNQSNSDGTLSGTVNNAGQFSGSSQYPGQQASPLSGTMTLSNGGNTLTGNLTQTISGNNYPVVFTLTKQ